jgi:hypothetical protein
MGVKMKAAKKEEAVYGAGFQLTLQVQPPPDDLI